MVFHKQDLAELLTAIAGDLNYSTVYGHGNLFHKGDQMQQALTGDPITVTMQGSAPGNVGSSCFDSDGLSLGSAVLVNKGTVESYYGSNRFGQYLGEKPTGNLGCLCVAPGSFQALEGEPYLEVMSMSGLQVDFFNDYIGGEIRLACYHDGDKTIPVTGISVSGKFREFLNHLRLSSETAVHDSYTGPALAVADNLKIF